MDAPTAEKHTCLRCKRTLDASRFHRRRATRTGLSPYCKACTSLYAKAYYGKNAKFRREQMREYFHSRRNKIADSETTRQCRMCERVLDKAEFRYVSKSLGTLSCCRSCENASDRMKKRGISPWHYQKLLEFQGNRCGVCGTDDPGSNRPDRRRSEWCIDHDHGTGQVRGLLCYRCNSLLGFSGDSEAVLRCAIHYLKNSPMSLLSAEMPSASADLALA